MPLLFISFYLLPAAVLSVGIWLVLFTVRELGVSPGWRRAIFVVAVAVLLAPAVVPAGTIMTAWVPNGLLVLQGAAPMLHHPRLVQFAAVSFPSTAVFAFALSWVVVRDRKSDHVPLGRRPLRIGAPVAAIVAMLTLYYSWIPDRRVESHIDWALIESAYGESFDALIDLGGISDADRWQRERDRLEQVFADDPIVSAVAINDRRLETFVGDSTLRLLRVGGEGGCSGSGEMWHHNRILRCTRKHPEKGRLETLEYRRASASASGEVRSIDIEFHYEPFLNKYTVNYAARAASGDLKIARLYDERVQGTWRIRQRFRLTASEEVHQTGALIVGARKGFGTYEVSATIQAESSLREGRESFSNPECADATEVCTWTSSTTGTLQIRGDRALLVFDDSFWMSDRLDVDNEMMVGRDDWGSATVYERMARYEF